MGGQHQRVHRATGRPLRLPVDDGPMRGLRVASAPRIGWLLATLRLLDGPAPLARRDTAAAALASLGLRADVTRLSRWESGRQHFPPAALDGYETLLGLPPATLGCVAASLKRSLDPDVRRVRLIGSPPADDAALEEVCARLESDAHGGVDWVLLAAGLQAGRRLTFAGERLGELAGVLLEEIARATGLGRTRRLEAARVLVQHPVAGPAMCEAAVDFVAAPGAQLVGPALGLLQEAGDQRAPELVVAALERPEHRSDAVRPATALLAGERFDATLLDDLEALVVEALPDSDSNPLGRPGAAIAAFDLLAALPTGRQQRVVHDLSDPDLQHRVRALLASGELVSPGRARPLAAAVTRHALESDTDLRLALPDEMLPRLVREALFHEHAVRRDEAGDLLAASAYAGGLAIALSSELTADHPPLVVGQVAALLGRLRPDAETRDTLLDLGLRPGHSWLAAQALQALAAQLPAVPPQADGPDHTPPFTAEAHDRLCRILERRTWEPAQHAALLLLGRLGSDNLDVIASHGTPAQRRAAQWWRELGPALGDTVPVRAAVVHDPDCL